MYLLKVKTLEPKLQRLAREINVFRKFHYFTNIHLKNKIKNKGKKLAEKRINFVKS